MNSIEQIISINIDNYIKYYNELTNISDISFIGSSYIKNNVSENWRKKFPDSKNGNYQLETGEKLSIEPVFYPGELFNWNKAKEKIKAIVGNYQDQNKETLLTSKEVFYSLQLELELNFEFKFIEFILHSKYIPVFAVEFMAFGENGYIDKILNSKNKAAIDSTIKRLNEIFEFYLIQDLSQIAIIQHLYKTVEAGHNKETPPPIKKELPKLDKYEINNDLKDLLTWDNNFTHREQVFIILFLKKYKLLTMGYQYTNTDIIKLLGYKKPNNTDYSDHFGRFHNIESIEKDSTNIKGLQKILPLFEAIKQIEIVKEIKQIID